MAKLEIAVEVAEDNILGKVAKVEETRRAFNNNRRKKVKHEKN